MLDLISKHFAVLSAGLVALSAALVTVFVFSYLSVFDWNLIWIIEYSDVAKFFLLAIALLSAFLMLLSVPAENAYLWLAKNDKSRRSLLLVTLGLWSAILGLNIYGDYKSNAGRYEYDISLFLSLLFVLGLVAIGIRDASHWRQGNVWVIYRN